jgi:SAM-dependent methyltransferase
MSSLIAAAAPPARAGCSARARRTPPRPRDLRASLRLLSASARTLQRADRQGWAPAPEASRYAARAGAADIEKRTAFYGRVTVPVRASSLRFRPGAVLVTSADELVEADHSRSLRDSSDGLAAMDSDTIRTLGHKSPRPERRDTSVRTGIPRGERDSRERLMGLEPTTFCMAIVLTTRISACFCDFRLNQIAGDYRGFWYRRRTLRLRVPCVACENQNVARGRDIEAFAERAGGYESGWLGQLHRDIADRVADIVLTRSPTPHRILDVGCGTGYLLRQLASRVPESLELAGIDAAAPMIEVARANARDARLQFLVGVAEQLPYSDATFDLVVSTTSFDHWRDQQAGLIECARVMAPGAHLVLADQFSAWLVPTLLGSRSGKARTKARAERLIVSAGLHEVEWHDLYAVIIRAATATK